MDLVHDNLCGPVTPAMLGGRRYFLLMVDDATCFMWAVLLPTKDAAADAVKRVKAEAEKETGCELKVLGPTMEESSPSASWRSTSPPKESSGTTLHHTHRSRMVWWSGAIRWSWRPHARS